MRLAQKTVMDSGNKRKINRCIDRIKSECSKEALIELHSLIASYLKYIALRFTKNESDAEDLVQDFWADIFVILDKYHYAQNGFSYLCKVMTNRAINFYNKNKRENEINSEILPNINYSTINESDIVNDLDAKQLLDKCFATLSDRERYIIEEYVIFKRTIRDIAEELNVSKSLVSKLKIRAIKKMSEVVAAHNEEVDKNDD